MSDPDAAPVALITGAASGIGAATAALFRSNGWHTAGLDLRASATDESRQVDVTDATQVRSAVDEIADKTKRASLLAVAVKRDRLAGQRLNDEI